MGDRSQPAEAREQWEDRPLVAPSREGRFAWCKCGKTSQPPFCDGAHASASTGEKPLKHAVEAEEQVWLAWCGCGKTGKPPFCDGSHSC